MKFIEPFYAVEPGEIYPRIFEVGEECPPELEASAIEQGKVEDDGEPESKGKGKKK